MLRKIFIAAIIAVFVLGAQIASAEIDWLRVKRISNKFELSHYIESQRKMGQTIIPVVLANGLTISLDEFIALCPASIVSQRLVSNDGQDTNMIYTLTDYPGTRVANAYLSGNTNSLTPAEKQLYNVAVGIVNEALKNDNVINREYHIFEEIMRRTTYLTGDMSNQPRFVTAIGALVDGKANCQGYTDAFYMLGRMCGLNVGRMSGTAGGGGHAWNTITFEDGKTYCVDVTWDDNNDSLHLSSYIYFNAPVEIMQVTHSWDPSLAPAIQGSIDHRYSYGSSTIETGYDPGRKANVSKYILGGNHSARANNAKSGLSILAREISMDGQSWFTVMTPYDERYSDFDKAAPYFLKEIANYFPGDVNVNFNVCALGNKYLFFFADFLD